MELNFDIGNVELEIMREIDREESAWMMRESYAGYFDSDDIWN